MDATQELIAIGVCNVANSFIQAFPTTGSLSRSAVNNSSGVRTPLGGLYTGFLVIIALLFFTPYFYYIPKTSLAAIIIAAVVFMVEVKVVKPMWRTKSKSLCRFCDFLFIKIFFFCRKWFDTRFGDVYCVFVTAFGNWHFDWDWN